MKLPWLILIAIVVLIAAAIGYFYSGAYNVAATQPHWKTTYWILDELRERSISFHSAGITSPKLDNPKLLEIGLRHFHEMCRECHGAPGYKPEEFAEGLYPKPPNLDSEDVQELSDAELFWVVKNGIRMTGMPAFGPTHKDDELWGVVAVSRRLPGLQPKQYRDLLEAAGLKDEKEKDDYHH